MKDISIEKVKLDLNRDYLRELIAEARRNETLGWILFVVGLLVLSGTLYFQRLISSVSSNYFRILDVSQSPQFNLVVLFTITLMGIGVILAGYYGSRKKRYMEKLRES